MISPKIDIISRPFEGNLPHAVSVFMDIMDSIAGERSLHWSYVGGFARDKLLGYEPNDFDVASLNNYFFRDRLYEIDCLTIGTQEAPRRKPHDYFINPYEFSNKKHPIHWIDADMDGAFAPTHFDFTLNHFAMKSDKRIYGPTYAWRDASRKILRISTEAPRSTNVLFRGVRFACRYGFEISPETMKAFNERIALHNSSEDKMGDDLMLLNLQKMEESGYGAECLHFLQSMGVELLPTTGHYNIHRVIDSLETKIGKGEAYYEPYNGYEE